MINEQKNNLRKILRWSEKWTQTDMVYLARGGFWLTLGQIVSSGSAFLLSVAFANLLPKETYGIYRYVLSMVGILTIPTLQGMSTALTQAVAKGNDGSTIPVLKARIKWGVLGAISSLAMAGYYYFQGNNILAISFLIVSVFIPFMDAFSAYDAIISAKKLFELSTRYFIITQLASIMLMLATLLITKNIIFILLAYFLSWTLFRLYFLVKVLKNYPPNDQIDPKTISYGKHLSLMGIIGTVANYLDRLLLFHFAGAAELAVYSIAIAPPEQIKSTFKNINNLALPKFTQQSKEEIKKTILRKTLILSLVLLLISIIYIILAPLFFQVFFPKYIDAIFYSQLFCLSLVTTAAALPSSVLQAHMAQKELYLFNIVSSVVQIVSLIILIYFWGILGAIIARVITRFFNLFYIMYLTNGV